MQESYGGKPMIPRPLVLALLLVAGFLILAGRLFQMQIVQAEKYQELADRNKVSRVPIPAARGLIRDRNGKILAKNNLHSSAYFIVTGDSDVDMMNLSKLAAILDLPMERLKEVQAEAGRVEPESVIAVKYDIPKVLAIELEERSAQFPGLIIESETRRSYPYGSYSGHVVGYIGLISSAEYEQKKHLGYSSKDFVGKFGVEGSYDSILRGKPGEKKLLVDVHGRVQGIKMRPSEDVKGEQVFDNKGNPVFEEDITRSERGVDIQLTIDIDLQSAIYPLMAERPGAVVVMDPRNGEVLALVSSPSFDPNLFGGRIDSGDWSTLVNEEGKPLQNRSIQNSYPPGSVFKPATAWAALDAGVASAKSSVVCDGVFELGTGKFRCWRRFGHGRVDFREAMAYSCDEFYYNLGYEAGVDAIAEKAFLLGLGVETGIDLGSEVSGRIPGPDWKLANIGEKWYGGDTINMSIGQGFMLTTPLQMARFTAALANGGRLVTPHLLKLMELPPRQPAGNLKNYLSLINDGMRAAVTDRDGTAHLLYGLPFTLAAKTGTAQDPPREWPHSWLITMAPYENPSLVLVAFLENVPEEEPGAVALAMDILSLPQIEKYVRGS